MTLPVIIHRGRIHARDDDSSAENVDLCSDAQFVILVIFDGDLAAFQSVDHVVAVRCVLA